jgi:Mce-associated membrane protein
VEDQQPDSGDLTTDATEAADGTPSRRRHRMPLLRERPATDSALEPARETTETTGVEAPVTETTSAEPPARARRWRLWRRRTEAQEPASEPVAETESIEDSKPAPRTPVGKARRAAKVVEPAAEEPAEALAPENESVADTTESEAAESSEAGEEEAGEEEPVVLVPYRPAGKRLTIAAAVAAALLVAAGAYGGAMLQPYLADRALVRTKVDIARTAADAITALWTYTPDDMETLPDRSARFLAGDFANEYRQYIDAIVATNKQAQVSNNTQVMGAAVESVTPSEATAIVFTNSVATSPLTKNIPSLRYLSYRLTMERRDADWLITRMTAITKLDLTPKL